MITTRIVCATLAVGGGDGAVDRGMEYILSLYGVYTVSIVYWTRRLYIGDWKSIYLSMY